MADLIELIERLEKIASRDSAISVTVRADDLRRAITALRTVRDAFGKIDALRAEVDGWREQHARDSAGLRRLCAARDEHKARSDKLEGECEALRQDAERYRWLRDGLQANLADAYEVAEFAFRGGLDAAIDAAMQGGAK